jgi:hypothetical protein
MPPSFESRPSVPFAHVMDSGRILMGAGSRLPMIPAHVADHGKIGFGAGLRLPVQRDVG